MADNEPTADVITATEIDETLPRDEAMFELAASAVDAVALFTSICTKDQLRDSYARSMPLLKKTLAKISRDSKELFAVSLKTIATVAEAVGKDRFAPDFDEVTKAVWDWLPTVAVIDSSFLPLLKSTLRLCDLMGGASQRLAAALREASLRALRTPFEDFATTQGDLILETREEACILIFRWTHAGKAISLLDAFAPRAEEISTALIDYLESADSSVCGLLTELAVAALPALQTSLSRAAAPVAARRALWRSHWRYFKNGIKRDERLRALYVSIVAQCLKALGSEALAVDDLEELTLMMKEQMEEEMRRRTQQMLPQTEVLYELSMMFGKLCSMTSRMCFYYLMPVMPLVFPLISVSPDKAWAAILIAFIIIIAPEYSLYRFDEIMSFLVSSLSDDEARVRSLTAATFANSMRAHPEWSNIAVKCVEALEDTVDRADARWPAFALSTEHTIAAIAHILKNFEDMIGPVKFQRLVTRLLYWLPFTRESLLSNEAYEFLADIVESRKLLLLCEPDAHEGRLLGVLVKALHFDSFPATGEGRQVKKRFSNIVRLMSEEENFAQWVQRADLDEEQQKTLDTITSDQ